LSGARSSALALRVEELAVERWFRDPPRLISAMATQPTVGVIQAFVLQWTKFSLQFPRWVGAIIANCPERDVIAYEVDNLMSEVVRGAQGGAGHYELLIRLGESVGLSREQVESADALPGASTFFEWLWSKARDPDWLIGFSAVNGLEILGDRNLPRRYRLATGTGLDPRPYSQSLGLSREELEFFEASDEADASHGAETLAVIVRHTLPGREGAVLAVLRDAVSRLRAMMAETWELAQSIDSSIGERS